MISDFFYWASKYIFLSQVLISLVVSGVSEWLLFNANSGIFQLYHGNNKLIFNEMMMRSVCFVLFAPLWHIIRILSRPVFLLNVVCLAEKQQIPILLSLVWLDRGSNPQSTAL
jgi:hypothetical protein